MSGVLAASLVTWAVAVKPNLAAPHDFFGYAVGSTAVPAHGGPIRAETGEPQRR